MMSQHAIRMVQRNLTPGGDKNGADINLALDALEMAFTHDHINAFVIVGGDSDFITLVEKLKQYDKKVFVVGGRQFTSQVMQKNCHEFIAYENLVQPQAGRARPGPRRENGGGATAAPADVAKAIPLVKRALKVLTDREVSPQLGLLKSTLLQLDSTFSERDYGVSTFRDFIEKVAKTGLVTLRHSGRSMMVDAVDTLDGAELPAGQSPVAASADAAPAEAGPSRPPAPPAPAAALASPGCQLRSRAGAADRRLRRATSSAARRSAAMADVRAPAQAVHPRRRSELRRAQVGLRDDHGVPARGPARRASSGSSAIGVGRFACSRALRCRRQPMRTARRRRRAEEQPDDMRRRRARPSRSEAA